MASAACHTECMGLRTSGLIEKTAIAYDRFYLGKGQRTLKDLRCLGLHIRTLYGSFPKLGGSYVGVLL